jgi:hypothetical protein
MRRTKATLIAHSTTVSKSPDTVPGNQYRQATNAPGVVHRGGLTGLHTFGRGGGQVVSVSFEGKLDLHACPAIYGLVRRYSTSRGKHRAVKSGRCSTLLLPIRRGPAAVKNKSNRPIYRIDQVGQADARFFGQRLQLVNKKLLPIPNIYHIISYFLCGKS